MLLPYDRLPLLIELLAPQALLILQDRKEFYGFSSGRGGGGTKGGDAGSRSKPGNDVSFVRHVPKFLQAGQGACLAV